MMSSPDHLTDALRGNVLFQTLSGRELKYLSRLIYPRVYRMNEIVYHQNDRGFGLYLISKGRVSIRAVSATQEHQLTVLEPGSFFGELALILPEHVRSTTAITLEETLLIGFFKPDLLQILERKPEMGSKILMQLTLVLSQRLVETNEKVTFLSKARGIEDVHENIY